MLANLVTQGYDANGSNSELAVRGAIIDVCNAFMDAGITEAQPEPPRRTRLLPSLFAS